MSDTCKNASRPFLPTVPSGCLSKSRTQKPRCLVTHQPVPDGIKGPGPTSGPVAVGGEPRVLISTVLIPLEHGVIGLHPTAAVGCSDGEHAAKWTSRSWGYGPPGPGASDLGTIPEASSLSGYPDPNQTG